MTALTTNLGPYELVELGQRVAAQVDKLGGPPAHMRPKFLWAREVVQQASKGDGTLGLIWFLPLLKAAIAVIMLAGTAVGVHTLATEGPKIGKSIGEAVSKAADRGLQLALIAVSAYAAVQFMQWRDKRTRKPRAGRRADDPPRARRVSPMFNDPDCDDIDSRTRDEQEAY